MIKLIGSILALGAFIGGAFGIVSWGDNRWAQAQAFREFKQFAQYEFKSNQVYKTQERQWQQQDRCSKTKDDAACKEARRLEAERIQYELELKELGKKK